MAANPLSAAALAALLGASLISGCASLRVTSDPPGAETLWSPNGLPPWRPWPPSVWNLGREGAATTTPTTPLADWGSFDDYVFITVAKEGYYPPRPQLASLHPFRRVRLHFTLTETEKHYARRMRDEGLAFYEGQWVDPLALGLVELDGEWMPPAERERRVMTARGLKEFRGQWLTPEEYDVALAAAMRAEGRELHKGRGIRAAQAARERLVDAAMERLKERLLPEALPPKVLGKVEEAGEKAGLELINASGVSTRWLLSGPSSRWVDLAPGDELAPRFVRLEPGRYTVCIFPMGAVKGAPHAAAAAVPASAEELLAPGGDFSGAIILYDQPLSAGFDYSLTYTGPATSSSPAP